jgi:hypothetical protein
MTKPPEIAHGLEALSTDPKARHEELVDIFARYILWARELVIRSSTRLAESAEERERLGRLFRAPFERMGDLDTNQRIAAYEFMKACLDSFAREVLGIIGNEGLDLGLGIKHAVRFRLDIEICDVETGQVVETETISRGGEKFLPDYWGRWLNQFGAR